MKKITMFISICLLSSFLAACSDNTVDQTESKPENQMKDETEHETITVIEPEEEEKEEPLEEVTDETADGIDHHEELSYEWSAHYLLEEGTYTLVLNQNEFGDASMLIAFVLENKNIKDIEHHAAHLFETSAEEVAENTLFHAKHEFLYNLMLNSEKTQFTFTIDEAGEYVLFTEHHAEEFQMEILNETGEEIIPENETEYEGHGHSHDH